MTDLLDLLANTVHALQAGVTIESVTMDEGVPYLADCADRTLYVATGLSWDDSLHALSRGIADMLRPCPVTGIPPSPDGTARVAIANPQPALDAVRHLRSI